ncbi:uncharacterized protein KY384_005041 [Bacidia gigantensis]|uniref:uncharacterized protein n=1 Tax=Bacidia gigantensis TaxID=2732470 RepID=UPI001D03A7B0|nr:uncharacterized protein KY384_005041 [Bacidia gigantensis]KAG8530538.1 hypothetical protein KY384_005041 [Bacidia gigantensis]
MAHPMDDVNSSQRGWILMSRSLGRALEVKDLEGGSGEYIMINLARWIADIRQKLPAATFFGNMKVESQGPKSEPPGYYAPFVQEKLDIKLDGLLNYNQFPSITIGSAHEYHALRLQDRLMKLNTSDALATNRAQVQPSIEEFMDRTLPKLCHRFATTDARSVFTHYDLSPRNVLVSGSPPSVTGLVDFEFAGFFPPEEEFANFEINNEGDWPADAYPLVGDEMIQRCEEAKADVFECVKGLRQLTDDEATDISSNG